MLTDFFIALYQGSQIARRIATKTAALAESFEMTFEDYRGLLRLKGVDWNMLAPRERRAILHLFQFGGAA